MTTLHLLGVSFRTAPVAVREALSYDGPQAQALLERAAAEQGIEAMVLSTCNRTEFYIVGDDARVAANPCVSQLMQRVQRERQFAPIADESCHRYRLVGTEAAEHLMRVACGLDSAIVGDMQILGQLKQAKGVASQAGTLGAHLERATTHAVRAGKAARTRTHISVGAASLGSAIASMVYASAPMSLARRKIVIVGAGKVARDVIRALCKRGDPEITIINRTQARAQTLANACGGRTAPLHALEQALERADFVVAATGAREPILRADALRSIAAARQGDKLRIFDAGMPRNVEHSDAVMLVDIDGIAERQAHVVAARKAAVPAVECIVAHELMRYATWLKTAPLEQALRDLFLQVEVTTRDSGAELAELGVAQDDAEAVVSRSLRRLLHGHAQRLRQLAREDVAREPSSAGSKISPDRASVLTHRGHVPVREVAALSG